jgi:predicted AlkP superfamily pyrophosphatase or phosphodiesterase
LSRFFLASVLSLILLQGCTSAEKAAEKAALAASNSSGPFFFEPEATNRADADNVPYVILVMIDGYRYDYNSMFSPPELSKIASEGVSAEGLRPVFPSKTFPNNYSIVTGLYPANHGIVSNEFYDPKKDASFALGDRTQVEKGDWYGGEPLWIAVQKQGLLSASFFWVGSEANIQNRHPNYYYRFDNTISYDQRVDQVVAWLNLPKEKRPHFITLYFEGVDSAAHKNGVQSAQTREAVGAVDRAMAKLRKGMAELKLPVNLIVVSDHGMVDLDERKVEAIDRQSQVTDLLPRFRVLGRGPQMLLYLNRGEDQKLVKEMQKRLRKGAQHFKVYLREELASKHYNTSERAGDLVIVPEFNYLVGLKSDLPPAKGGNHGWDPAREKNMNGIFWASGPAFKEKARLPIFENINVYPLVLEALGLKPQTKIDGKLSVVQSAFKKRAP